LKIKQIAKAIILDYFGENTTENLWYMPYCISTKKTTLEKRYCIKILNALAIGDLSSREIQNKVPHKQEMIIFVIKSY
jgi:hypothetical protein